MIRLAVAIGCGALCCSCTKLPASPGNLRTQGLARLGEISRKCGLPASVFKLIGTDELHIQPSPDEKYERLDCALIELKNANLPLKLGFVGNETYETGNQH
ncbi:MAG: hypothetical protein QOJ91_1547 [Sphingomonadales bacterium]|jgi:hypothetical protein|nr:hypothetical protein [Sphingomonadales bacterium]